MPVRFPIAAFACAGLLASTGALAQSASASASASASVQAGPFSYQLIDLDLTDSITPSLSFTERVSSTSHYDNGLAGIDYHHIDSFGATSVTHTFGSAGTSSSAIGGSARAGFSLPSPQFQQFASQHFYGWDFELTPATGLMLQAGATLEAAHQGEHIHAYASASMWGHVNHLGSAGMEESIFRDFVQVETGARSYALSGYLHSGTESLTGSLGLSLEARTLHHDVSPVPEPSAYAMLLAGLGLLGWRARRGA